MSKQYLALIPAVDGGRVYAADLEGEVEAIDAASGDVIWSVDLDVPASGGPGVGEGLVLVGTGNGEVLALAAADGALVWRTRVSSEVLAPPLAARGIVVVRTGDGKIVGLSVGDGSRLWVYDRTVPALTLRGTSTPALVGDGVVAGFDSGRLVALTIADGQAAWEATVAVPRGRSELERMVDIDADPLVVGNVVYTVTYQGQLAALDLASGSVLWRREMSAHSGFAADDANLYLTDATSHVWAMERTSGASVWRQTRLERRDLTAPAVIGRHLAVADFEGWVHWLRAEDGEIVARVDVGDAVIARPVASDGVLFVYERDGTLTALRPAP